MEQVAKPPLEILRGKSLSARKWFESLTRLINLAVVFSSDADVTTRTTASGSWATLHSVTISSVNTTDLVTVSFSCNVASSVAADLAWFELLIDGAVVGPRYYYTEPTGTASADSGNIVIPSVRVSALEGEITVLVRYARAGGTGTFKVTSSRFDWEVKR